MVYLLLDLAVLFVFSLLIGPPSWIAIKSYPYLSALPFFVSVPLLVLIFMMSFLLCVALISHLVPKPKAGKYAFPNHHQSFLWGFHFCVQRIARLSPWRNFFMSFNTLTFLFLKALGGKIDFGILTSSNIELSEIYMIRVCKNAMLGGGADFGCHFIRDKRLVLAPITIEEGAQILIDAKIGPDCVVGKHTVIGVCTKLGYKVKIGESVVVGNDCILQTHIQVGDKVKIGDSVFIESAVTIEEGVSIPSGTWIRSGARITKDTKIENTRWQTLSRSAREIKVAY